MARHNTFANHLIGGNEKAYGAEIRAKYGDEVVDASNEKISEMTDEQFAEHDKLSTELNAFLKVAVAEGDATSKLAKEVFKLHKEWLCFYWSEYTKKAHMGLTQMYVDDPRFTEYYDKIAPGAAVFLRDTVHHFCST